MMSLPLDATGGVRRHLHQSEGSPRSCGDAPIDAQQDGACRLLSTTWSVCPSCLARIPARKVARGNDVYLEKSCPEHGPVEVVLWRGLPDYESWGATTAATRAPTHGTEENDSCPHECGLCASHQQPTCCALLEVTQRCDLGCSFCFASSCGEGREEPSLEAIGRLCRRLLSDGRICNLQLSGGEPTLRDDLPEIVALARSLGFQFVQLNSNGRRLSRDRSYVQRLADAGLSCVFLQFDGTEDGIYRRIRGRDLLEEKLAAIETCTELNIGIVLVPTLIPGINVHNLGETVRFALDRVPAVRGVHIQPVSYFGRYPKPPADSDRITIPEVIRELSEQTEGMIGVESFRPGSEENPYCSFHANFLPTPDGRLMPLTRMEPQSCCVQPTRLRLGAARDFVARRWSIQRSTVPGDSGENPAMDGWDRALDEVQNHTFFISGMAFQDAWNLDLERLRDCYLHVIADNGRIVPFCAYNLTDMDGRSLYRPTASPAKRVAPAMRSGACTPSPVV